MHYDDVISGTLVGYMLLIVNAGTVAVKSLIEEDRRLTVSDISTKVGVSYGSVHSILKNQLKMSKVHARWVPRLLKMQKRNDVFKILCLSYGSVRGTETLSSTEL